jgi:hypothetical protein
MAKEHHFSPPWPSFMSQVQPRKIRRIHSNPRPSRQGPFSIAPRLAFIELNAKEEVMLKVLSMAATVAVLFLSPAYAASDLCTDAHMKKMDQMIAGMTDAAKKKEAMMHLGHVEGRDEEGQRSRVHGAHGRGPQGDGPVSCGFFAGGKDG